MQELGVDLAETDEDLNRDQDVNVWEEMRTPAERPLGASARGALTWCVYTQDFSCSKRGTGGFVRMVRHLRLKRVQYGCFKYRVDYTVGGEERCAVVVWIGPKASQRDVKRAIEAQQRTKELFRSAAFPSMPACVPPSSQPPSPCADAQPSAATA